MKSLEELKSQINQLKTQLNSLMEASSEVNGEIILQTSKNLDELINEYNKMMRSNDS